MVKYQKKRKYGVPSKAKLALMARKKYRKPKITRNLTTVAIGKGLPKKIIITHKYNHINTLTSTLGVMTPYLYSCNGMASPSFTGGSHKPLYFGQLAAIYNHYTVIGSKMVVKFTPSTANDESFAVCLFKNDDTSLTVTDITAGAEQTSGKLKIVPPNSNNVFTLTSKWSAKKTFGGSVLGNDNLQGTPTTNPGEQTFYTLMMQTIGSSATTSVLVDVYIEYIAVWEELKDIAQS